MAYKSIFATTQPTTATGYKSIFKPVLSTPVLTPADTRTQQAKDLMNGMIQSGQANTSTPIVAPRTPEVKQGVMANLWGGLKDAVLHPVKSLEELIKSPNPTPGKEATQADSTIFQIKGTNSASRFLNAMSIQAGITEAQMKDVAPKDRLAVAGALAGLAFPSKGIGMISEGLPGARGVVGLVGKGIKKITDIFKRAESLSPELRQIETKAFEKIATQGDQILADYKANNGKVVNADAMRPYFTDVGYAGHNAEAVQEPVSYLSKKAYTEGLKNKGKYATFTSGGSGAGKTSALENIPKYEHIADNSAVILDSNLSNIDSAIKKINQAVDAGKKPELFYVYREPVDALENGVVKRMIENPAEKGRLVPNNVIADNTIGSFEVAKQLESKGVSVNFVDNSLGKGKQTITTSAEIEKKLQGLNRENLTKQFNQKIDEIYKTGKITPEQYKGYTGKVPKVISQERGFITSAKEAVPQATKIAGQYIPRDTDNLAIMAKNLIKSDINTAEKLALTGTDDKAVATASELLKHYSNLAEKATDGAVKNALYDKAAQVANTIAPKLTEQGRAIQAASILGRLTPEGQVKFAASQIAKFNEAAKLGQKIPELTGEQANKIIGDMKAINAMPDGTEKAMKFQELQNYIKDLLPTPLFKKIVAVWKAGLLTGIKTTGVNMFANLSHIATETAKDIPATMVDKIVSLFTGARSKTLNLKGLTAGAKEGVSKGIRYLTTGFDERNIGTKLDFTRINFGKGKIAQALQKYTDTVFHLMGTEDQPFYYASKVRSLYEQAKVGAINKGLKGAEAQKFIDELIQNPTDKMIKYATTDAEISVFQNKTVLGEAARSIQKVGGGAGEIIVPFGRTPSAVAMQVLNYSPVGIATTIIENIGKGRFDQRLFSQGIGRGLTGTAVLALGASLYKKGMITTARPTGEKEQKLWELEGKQANSIKIGGEWRQVQVLGPIGNMLLVGGSFQKAFNNSGSPSEAMSQGLADTFSAFTQQTFLTGISNFIDAISDPARSAKTVAGSTLASVIPTIVSDVARATDTKERRADEIFQKLQARIPGVREGLEPQVNVLGQERGTVGNPLEIMADPTRPSPTQATPVISELRRLWDNGQKVSPSLLGDKAGYKGLTPQQNTELWKKAGEITDAKLGSLFTKPEYQKLDEEAKGKIVNDVVGKSQTSARAGLAIELTQDLQGEELKAKLSELKKGGLLTQEVFNLYLKIR